MTLHARELTEDERQLYRRIADAHAGELDPYHALLIVGELTYSGPDRDAWRAELRRQARRDGFSIGTVEQGGVARAIINRPAPQDDAVRERSRNRHALLAVADHDAEALGHTPIGWLPAPEIRISACEHCGARMLLWIAGADVGDAAGEAFLTPCPVKGIGG